jgi:uncharacterized protein YjbI with pentapeptide repeats
VRQIHFEVHFKVYFGFLKFYTLKMKGTTFTDSSLVAVEWAVLFSNCDLYRSEFEKAIADKADFRTSYNYSIDPTKTKLKKAQFSIDGLKGLLTKYDIIVE